jgi:solute carrier family 44 protein 1 (choline transporter-like protein)
VDEELKKGPLFQRKCTDCLCLMIFFAFCGGLGFITFYGYTKGDPELLLSPIDGAG